jgi:hypothetical protein
MEPNLAMLTKRAKESALERLPAMPTKSTLEAWEDFRQALEEVEPSDCAHEEADSWDWVIYHGKALALCANLPTSVVSEAEAQAIECGGIDEAFESGGLGGVACLVAYWIIYQAVSEAIEEARQELLGLAQGQIDNLVAM